MCIKELKLNSWSFFLVIMLQLANCKSLHLFTGFFKLCSLGKVKQIVVSLKVSVPSPQPSLPSFLLLQPLDVQLGAPQNICHLGLHGHGYRGGARGMAGDWA